MNPNIVAIMIRETIEKEINQNLLDQICVLSEELDTNREEIAILKAYKQSYESKINTLETQNQSYRRELERKRKIDELDKTIQNDSSWPPSKMKNISKEAK